MRIGLDITKALTPRDGVGTYTAELLNALIAAISDASTRSDIELVLYSMTTSPDSLTASPDSLTASPEEAIRGLLPAAASGVRISTSPPHQDPLDLFHVTGWAVPPDLTCPLVYTCYDLTFLSHPALHTLDNKVHCLTGVLQARLADAHFVVISRATARDLEERLGVPASRAHVIYPAMASIFRPQPEEDARRHLLRRFGIEGCFALAVGTLEPRKNLHGLIEAYNGLDEDLKRGCPLLVAGGSGWKVDATKLFTSEHVRQLGFVERDDLVALYSATSVFAYPSLAEGFGLPVAEAMACGAPVITSNTSSLPEVAGQAARLVDPSDTAMLRKALRDLIEKPAERQRLSRDSLERARTFSWERTARQTLDLYHEILNAT